MEALSRMVEAVVGGGFISAFSVGNVSSCPIVISHLLFADDTINFCDADSDQILHLGYTLTWFEAVLGLKINLGELALVPVGEVSNIEDLSSILGCKTSLPMTYLGEKPYGTLF
jgi:hypothetical protein